MSLSQCTFKEEKGTAVGQRLIFNVPGVGGIVNLEGKYYVVEEIKKTSKGYEFTVREV